MRKTKTSKKSSHPVRNRLDEVGHQRRRAVDELGELVDLGEVARVEEVGDPVGGLGACDFFDHFFFVKKR